MSDNKNYRGKIDRIRVAFGQDQRYEVDYFVYQYIKSRGYTVTSKNQGILHEYLEKYPHSGTVMRDALTAWLDERIPRGWIHSAIPEPQE